jgi:hypothetical protein
MWWVVVAGWSGDSPLGFQPGLSHWWRSRSGPPIVVGVNVGVRCRFGTSTGWFAESDSAVFWVFVGLEALFVDGDVVVEPAESDQVVWVGSSSLGPGDPVVDFDPVGRIAPVDFAVSSGSGQLCPGE